MPELPEVERAARLLEAAVRGRTLSSLRPLHPALRRRLGERELALVAGRRVERVERRGKHQLVLLDDGSVLHVHFRMAGDWTVGDEATGEPRHARAVLEFVDGTRVWLTDPRALATVEFHAPGSDRLPVLGPDAADPALDAATVHRRLGARRGPLKPVLLDQRTLAGLGNIYAAEALWWARLSPVMSSAEVSVAQARRLLRGIRRVLERARAEPGRYASGERAARFRVYGRAGEPCRRCRTPIERLVQGGRSTYYCPGCQRDERPGDAGEGGSGR